MLERAVSSVGSLAAVLILTAGVPVAVESTFAQQTNERRRQVLEREPLALLVPELFLGVVDRPGLAEEALVDEVAERCLRASPSRCARGTLQARVVRAFGL